MNEENWGISQANHILRLGGKVTLPGFLSRVNKSKGVKGGKVRLRLPDPGSKR